MDFACQERNKILKEKWYLHNALRGETPMVVLESWGFNDEVITPRLKCTGEFARKTEFELYQNFVNQELFDDDRVTPDRFEMGYHTEFKLYDLDMHKEFATGREEEDTSGVSMRFLPVIEDLEDDFHKIKPSIFSVDIEGTEQEFQLLTDTFGDILPVKMKMDCLYSVPTQLIIHLMGMENMMLNLAQYPDLFKKLMDQAADDTLAYYDMLEENHLILPTTEYESVGQGTFAFNHELPDTPTVDGRYLTRRDVWGYMDSQETLSISPKMFEEIIFPCYEKIGSQFGLLSYGCCEPVDRVWDNCISKFKNLRKVSISHGAMKSSWANASGEAVSSTTENLQLPSSVSAAGIWTRRLSANISAEALPPPGAVRWKSRRGISIRLTIMYRKPGDIFRSSGKKLKITGNRYLPGQRSRADIFLLYQLIL